MIERSRLFFFGSKDEPDRQMPNVEVLAPHESTRHELYIREFELPGKVESGLTIEQRELLSRYLDSVRAEANGLGAAKNSKP